MSRVYEKGEMFSCNSSDDPAKDKKKAEAAQALKINNLKREIIKHSSRLDSESAKSMKKLCLFLTVMLGLLITTCATMTAVSAQHDFAAVLVTTVISAILLKRRITTKPMANVTF